MQNGKGGGVGLLKWQEPCYIGDGVRNAEKIRRKLDEGRMAPGVYLLTLSRNPENVLEILPAAALCQKWTAQFCPPVIGIAKGKDEAIEMVSRILLEVYEKTGAFRVEEYLKNR